jgi:hypothetical protein
MWLYKSQPFESLPENYYGFVYLITNTITNKKYIGKKLFYSAKTKQVKGKKKRFKIESNWQEYWGSNKVLLADIEELGQDKFTREILQLCLNKGECTYWEAKYQFEYDVLRHPDIYYNEWIMCKVHRVHLKVAK